MARRVKHLPTMWDTWVQSLGQEDPLEKEMAIHSSTRLENPMEGGAWYATVHGGAKSQTKLRGFTFTFSQEELYLKLIKQRPTTEVREELARRLSSKESSCDAGNVDSNQDQQDPLEEGMAYQHSCLENPKDRVALWARVHGGLKESDTTKETEHACTHHSQSI